MPAKRRRQSVTAPEEIDGPSLAVVLRKDAAPGPLLGSELVVSLIHRGDHFLPTKLIGKVLRQNCAHVAVLAARHWEGQRAHVGDELLHRENWHYDWAKPCSARDEQHDDPRLQPNLT